MLRLPGGASMNKITADADTWRAFLAALSIDEICELDQLVYAARIKADDRLQCSDPSCGCRR